MKNKFISKELIEKIVIYIVENCDEVTKNHFSGLYFTNMNWDFAVATCSSDGKISTNYENLINYFSKCNTSYLQKNLELIQIIMHEIGHLKHNSQRLSSGFEAKLMRLSGADYVYGVYTNRALRKINDVEFAVRYGDRKFKEFYEKNHAIIPSERLTEIRSIKDLLESLRAYPSFDNKYFVEYRHVNNLYVYEIKSGYKKLENGKYNVPLIEYFTNLGRIKELERLGIDIERRKLPGEVRNFDSITRMTYGLPIAPKDVIEINKMKIKTRR